MGYVREEEGSKVELWMANPNLIFLSGLWCHSLLASVRTFAKTKSSPAQIDQLTDLTDLLILDEWLEREMTEENDERCDTSRRRFRR